MENNRVERATNSRGGFTLVELILVVVIIGILAGAVIPVFKGRSQQARVGRAKQDIAVYIGQIDSYALDHNDKYPTSLAELAPNYVRQVNKDPWGNEYVYKPSGENYDLFCAGPDGSPGTEDDVTLDSAVERR